MSDGSRSPSIELSNFPVDMDRVRRTFGRGKPDYEPLQNGYSRESLLSDQDAETECDESPFSWVEYAVFLVLGIAMLWAWNMFLAAAPYFQRRFESNKSLLDSFQSAEISVSTVTNLATMIILTKMQSGASYPRRIVISLIITTACFTLLAISTAANVSANVYFWFLMVMVCLSSVGTGMIQNGLFAYAPGFGRSEYTQAIMTGQAIAGVLPCIAQIASVLGVKPPNDDADKPALPPPSHDRPPPLPPSVAYKSARIYFTLATCISVAALISFLYLLRRKQQSTPAAVITNSTTATETSPLSRTRSPSPPPRVKSISMLTLFRLVPSLSLGVFLCFSITMLYPVFTALITSLRPQSLPAPIFIPLAFLLWNVGDLVGRLLTLIPSLHLYHHPLSLFCIAMARLIFIPLYFLCNIRGNGAVIESDIFYLAVVQVGFGITNGYLGSECMMGAGEWVKGEDEKRAAGAWMGLCLVAGLAAGSLCSFAVVGAI